MMDRVRCYRNYMLIVLLVILAFNYVDRFALGVVLDDIKTDLRLSDSQLGFMSGIAFSLMYSIMGIPIARWADRGNRVAIISVTAAVWSVMVGLSGMAATFVQLLLIRVGVGVGEAGCVPPAHSLIADYFTRAERPRAVSMYLQGNTVGVALGYFLAGWLSEFYGWRVMFMVLGLPGLVLGALAWLTLREPRKASRTAGDTSGDPKGETVALGERSDPQQGTMAVCRMLWAIPTFRHLLLSFAVLSFFNYGLVNWQPVFFKRSFGMQAGELGTWLAGVYGISTLLGVYLGGVWASRRAPGNEVLQLRVSAVATVGFNGLLWALVYFCQNRYLAFALMGVSNMGSTAIYGPLFATFQTLVPPRTRATAIAIVYFLANLIGLGLGPLLVGTISDALLPVFGQESLRYALLFVCPGYIWGAWHLWLAARTVAQDVETVERRERGLVRRLAHG